MTQYHVFPKASLPFAYKSENNCLCENKVALPWEMWNSVFCHWVSWSLGKGDRKNGKDGAENGKARGESN